MHPNVFLKTFWRLELKPQVFVATSFDQSYQQRFDKVVVPAIEGITLNGTRLAPHRVDLSRSGDSILMEIMDGIAHSRFVLADVSSVGRDSKTGLPYRNGNVMYEVGIALACRQAHEVLLIRDDRDPFLFDVSAIPHMQVDFTNEDQARQAIQSKLIERLNEQTFIDDARIDRAISGLSDGEVGVLKSMLPGRYHGYPRGNVTTMVSIPRLLDKQLIKFAGEFENKDDMPAYCLTPLGSIAASRLKANTKRLVAKENSPTDANK